MECLNMSSNDQNQAFFNTISGPRISFSNDCLEPQVPMKVDKSYREAPVSSDFEFSVPTYSMISADEVFFNGKMLPLKENFTKATTLRDELRAGDDDYDGALSSPRQVKGVRQWKEMFGLKRSSSHINNVAKKGGKSLDSLARIDEMNAL